MRFYILLIVLFCFTAFAGCKIYSWSGVSIPADVKTVSIERFQNNAPLVAPTLAQDLTEQLRDKFLTQTNLKLADFDGDYQLSGEITNYTISPITIQGNDQAAQNRLEITIKVKFENNLRPEENWTETFRRYSDFSASQTISSVEGALIQEINSQLVQDVFNKTASNW